MVNEAGEQPFDRTVGEAAANKGTKVTHMVLVKQARSQRGSRMPVADTASHERLKGTSDSSCCGRLLDGLREYSRLPALEWRREQLWGIIADALRLVEDNLETNDLDPHGVQVHCAVPEDIVVEVAKHQMVKAIANVVQNAFEAFADGPRGFTPGRITISAQVTELNGVEIVIEDNGKGMDAETLQNIRRFVPGRSTKRSRHCGLGLPTARRYIGSHGGDIVIESRENEGTYATIMFPLEDQRSCSDSSPLDGETDCEQ